MPETALPEPDLTDTGPTQASWPGDGSSKLAAADKGVVPSAAEGVFPASRQGMEMLAKFFRAAGDPSRLALLELLIGGERNVSECVALLGITQSRASSHLACLAQCGYVGVRRDGRFTYYRVVDPRVRELVALAQGMTADNAEEIAACSRV